MSINTEPNAATLLGDGEREQIARLVAHSLEVIEGNQDPSGAYPASPTFSVYRFSWFRDGAFIADATSRFGHRESAEAFFGWCNDVLIRRRSRIDSLIERQQRGEEILQHEFLPCRYALDGSDAQEDWWEFQLDGYGTWLWALEEHRLRTQEQLDPYLPGVELAIRYLVAFWSKPCFDWWEEHREHQHVATLASLYAGLAAAAGWEPLTVELREAAETTARKIRALVLERGVHDGTLVKWLGGDSLDASLVSCATPFQLIGPGDRLTTDTIAAIERTLVSGGVHRYLADTYFGGGEWILLSGLLGWHYAETGRVAEAVAQLRWIVSKASPEGDLPEQVNDHLLAPAFEQVWIERWGTVATPLLWSHAMFLTLVHALGLAETGGRR